MKEPFLTYVLSVPHILSDNLALQSRETDLDEVVDTRTTSPVFVGSCEVRGTPVFV